MNMYRLQPAVAICKQPPTAKRRHNKQPGRLTSLQRNSGCDCYTPGPRPHFLGYSRAAPDIPAGSLNLQR